MLFGGRRSPGDEDVAPRAQAQRVGAGRGGGVVVVVVMAAHRRLEQRDLTLQRLTALVGRDAEEILEDAAQLARDLRARRAGKPDLVEGEAHVAVPGEHALDHAHLPVGVAVASGRERAVNQQAQAVVDAVERLDRRRRVVEGLRHRPLGDVDQLADPIGGVGLVRALALEVDRVRHLARIDPRRFAVAAPWAAASRRPLGGRRRGRRGHCGGGCGRGDAAGGVLAVPRLACGAEGRFRHRASADRLYWSRRRPQSWFGPMVIGWGLVGALYILQSSSESWLFSIGLFWEKVFGLATYVLILAFPTGRFDRPVKIVLAVGVVTVLGLATAIQLLQPQVGAGASISSCRSLCPHNELALTSDPAVAADLFKVFSYAVLTRALATAALVVRRYVTGSPPRRRALAVGMPVALLFLLCEILFQLSNIVGAD